MPIRSNRSWLFTVSRMTILLLLGCKSGVHTGVSADAFDGSEMSGLDAQRADASSVDASSVDVSSVDASSVDASSVDASSVDANGGGGPAQSCIGLASTCGLTGNGPCCESPMVNGGTYDRSYDVGADMMYAGNAMDSPATVSSFRLDKYEVSVRRFRQFVIAGQGTQLHPPPAGTGVHPNLVNSGWNPTWNVNLAGSTAALVAAINCSPTLQTWTDIAGGNEDRPMNCLSWYEALAFCAWDGGYPPTEAEWNYAATGGNDQRAYPWSYPLTSVDIGPDRASYYVDATTECFGDGVTGCALSDLVVGGTKPAGDGRWGQSDLSGNVWEWVLDSYSNVYPLPCNDCAALVPANPVFRVLRGGSFINPPALQRTAHRDKAVPGFRSTAVGVRCARVL